MRTLDLLDETEAAGLLGVSRTTLARMRRAGTGPSFLRLGRKVRYRSEDVVAWVTNQVREQPGVPR